MDHDRRIDLDISKVLDQLHISKEVIQMIYIQQVTPKKPDPDVQPSQ